MSRPLKPPILAARLGLPEGLLEAEQRLADRALRHWRAAGRVALPDYADKGLMVADPAGRCEIMQVSEDISATFSLAAGQLLAFDTGLQGVGHELRAACDLVALGGQPVPFELCVQAGGLLLLRGIALPVPHDRVQVVMSWREVLNRSAAAGLKRELRRALAGLGQARAPRVDALPLGRQDQR